MKLILSHSYTDFDALASQLAAARLYAGTIPVLAAELNGNVREFLALARDELPFVQAEALPDEPIEHLILVDTSQPPHVLALEGATIPTLIIDHHPFERSLAPHEQLIYADVGATVTILARQLAERGATLSPLEATLCLLGIYEDTGNLTLHGTTAQDAACAAWLLEQGARIGTVSEFLERPLSAAQDQVYRVLERNLRLAPMAGHTVLLAWAHVEGTVPQLSPLAHRLRDHYAPDVLAIAIGTSDAGTQLIFRSDEEVLDSSAFAAQFGGGGHAAAAAAFVRDQAAEPLLNEVERLLRNFLRPAVTAADLMTRHVVTVPLDASVDEAATLQERSGHSALPVVDHQRVVHGLVARRDLRQAQRHGLGAAPVQRYMWRGPALVTPDMPLAELRRTLTNGDGRDTGRLLVVDNQRRLLGILTRADMLRVWGEEFTGTGGSSQLGRALEQFLDPAILGVLQTAARLAESQSSALYVVGGTVRDMLLKQPAGDLDLLVEGNAVALAEQLARDLGGQVRSHAQFQTATLELPSGWAPAPAAPLALDFITARTEFYERPAALPSVESASLRHDLHRRDFTINTLAICLNPSRYGHLFDYYGGRRDLERRLIRVLHNLSFIDDPTRIVRAARLAARLGFTIEPRSRALIDDAIEQDLLGRTSPQRLWHELELTLAEREPERVLALLHELRALQAIFSALTWTPDHERWFRQARAERLAEQPGAVLPGLLTYQFSPEERMRFMGRFPLGSATDRVLGDIAELHTLRAELEQPALPNSRLDRLLHGMAPGALLAASIAEREPIAARIKRYLAVLRPTQTWLNGDDLRALGFTPGPQFKAILADARAAQLDGAVASPEEQIAWLQAHFLPQVD